MQAYDFKVIYRPGRTNIADALSRLNRRVPCGEGEHHDYLRSVVENSTRCALIPSEIGKASAADPEISLVKECVRTGDWSACAIPAYLHVKNELCSYGQILLRGSRIVIPQVLREHVLKLAHEGHQGIVKTKCRLRSKVWWPKCGQIMQELSWLSSCQRIFRSRSYGTSLPTERTVARLCCRHIGSCTLRREFTSCSGLL